MTFPMLASCTEATFVLSAEHYMMEIGSGSEAIIISIAADIEINLFADVDY